MEKFALPTQVVRFGHFELDLRAGELRKQGARTKLQEQPFQVLAMLLERPNQLVTREELRNKLWPADTFVDFDHSLNRAINKLREALGDSADAPQFIETLPKRGYRFVALLKDTTPEIEKFRGPLDSILVFPFEIQSFDPDSEYLAVGIPGSVVHSLSQIPGLRVISWRNSANEASQKKDPLIVARNLGVKTVLIGRLWQRSGKLRLHVDLLETTNGEEIWGGQYDREVAELFVVQDDISREVSQKLRIKMAGADESRLTKRYTDNIDAYQLYVRARRWCERRSNEGYKRAVEHLTRAVEMDPNYALAYAELAQCFSLPCWYGSANPHLTCPKARAHALRALELDQYLAEGHEVLATVLQYYDWNWLGAEKEFQLAIELNPNYAAAHYHYSYLLSEQGRFDEAICKATRALSRDPMSPLLNAGLAFILVHARKFDLSVKQCLTAMDVDPNMTLSYISLGTAYEQLGKCSEAVEVYEKGIALGGAVALQKAFLGHTYGTMGDHGRARKALHELQELAKTSYVPLFTSALIHEGLGEVDLAIKALQVACENRDAMLIYIKVWPQLDKLRGDPRFQEVERRVGLRS